VDAFEPRTEARHRRQTGRRRQRSSEPCRTRFGPVKRRRRTDTCRPWAHHRRAGHSADKRVPIGPPLACSGDRARSWLTGRQSEWRSAGEALWRTHPPASAWAGSRVACLPQRLTTPAIAAGRIADRQQPPAPARIGSSGRDSRSASWERQVWSGEGAATGSAITFRVTAATGEIAMMSRTRQPDARIREAPGGVIRIRI